MKRIILLALFLGVAMGAFADRNVIRHEDIKTFLKTKTYVVLEDNPMSAYNFKIKEAVEKSWTITPYEFISSAQFEEMRKDIDKSFLVMIQVKFTKDKLEALYNFMSVALGSGVSKITDMPDIVSIPLSYSSVAEDSYVYKIESFIRFMQEHIRMLEKNPELIKNNIYEYYNKSMKDNVKSKELWLLEKDVDKSIRSLDKIRKTYPHIVRIVKEEDIEKAIAEKNQSVVFLHKVGPEGTRLQARCYKVLVGAGDDKFYYFDYHTIDKSSGDGFLSKDFKRIK
ncbi:MAG: hypothetical protein JW783_11405 [Bacteroidales bacterium]|nr:hypothetical protein [Bacteroidales bacterium]MBN2750499.1 hypothetical protein [Bacteroidales bacterium]